MHRRHLFFVTLLFVISFKDVQAAKNHSHQKFFNPFWKLSLKSISKMHMDYQSLVDVIVDDASDKEQLVALKLAAIHPQRCRDVLKKLSRFEMYDQWLSFIKNLNYNPQTKQLHFIVSHTLAPFDMSIDIITPRPRQKGKYSYMFNKGMLRGLEGTIYIDEVNDQCDFFIDGHWKGKKTPFSNFTLQLLTKTLLRMGSATLLRKASL